MNMRKFWIKMNILYEKLMLYSFVVVLLIVIYGLYDGYYVFHHASDDSYLRYKPVAGESIPEELPITEDMVAWVTLDDTNIDYPVMQGEDNMKYLNINPYGEFSLSGSIFLDSRNNRDFSDTYSLLYGHHMEYGVMFGALDEYMTDSYLKSHSSGTLLVGRTKVESYSIKVFACCKVNIFNDETFFDTDYQNSQSFKERKKYIKSKATVYDDTAQESDHILVLSTCTEPVSKNRLLVFCYIYK